MKQDTQRKARELGTAAGEQNHGGNPYDWTTQRKLHDAWGDAYVKAARGDTDTNGWDIPKA